VSNRASAARAVIYLVAFCSAACGDGEGVPRATAATDATPTRVWIGDVVDTDAKVGAVEAGGAAVLFLCGGDRTYPELTRWFSGQSALDEPFRFTAGEFEIAGEPVGKSLAGTLLREDADGQAWQAASAAPETLSGVYSGEAACGRVGLIVSQASSDDEATGQGACLKLIDETINVEQVNPVLPLVRRDGAILVTIASDPDREIRVHPLMPGEF
jgi:hypothetical protein